MGVMQTVTKEEQNRTHTWIRYTPHIHMHARAHKNKTKQVDWNEYANILLFKAVK